MGASLLLVTFDFEASVKTCSSPLIIILLRVIYADEWRLFHEYVLSLLVGMLGNAVIVTVCHYTDFDKIQIYYQATIVC